MNVNTSAMQASVNIVVRGTGSHHGPEVALHDALGLLAPVVVQIVHLRGPEHVRRRGYVVAGIHVAPAHHRQLLPRPARAAGRGDGRVGVGPEQPRRPGDLLRQEDEVLGKK